MHPQMKQELSATMETLVTPQLLAKAALNRENELGLAGSMKYGKNKPQPPTGSSSNPLTCAATSSGSLQQTGTVAAVAAKPGVICEYCGIKNHPAEECKTKIEDLRNGHVRERSVPFPKLTYAQRMKAARKAKAAKKAAEAAAAATSSSQVQAQSNQIRAPPALTYDNNVAAATSYPAQPATPGFYGARPGFLPTPSPPQAYFSAQAAAAPEARFDPHYLAQACQGGAL